MREIKLRAFGKINLALDVTGRRPDGYHELDMIMQTVSLCDDITLTRRGTDGGITVSTNLDALPSGEGNLAFSAAKLLRDEFNISEGVDITIKKVIPVAAGMAGGSSDCAAVLRGMNTLFSLGLDPVELEKRGLKLGADVPYCIRGGTARARGVGEVLTPLPSPPRCAVVIAKPPVAVSTAYVYRQIDSRRITERPDIESMTDALYRGDLRALAALLSNVLEAVTAEKYPVIADIERIMTGNGAAGARMSGSGPAVFGLFEDDISAGNAVDALLKSGLANEVFKTEFAGENVFD